MALSLDFIKCSGAGNDFVLVDSMNEGLRLDKPGLARAICSRHFGVGGDGLLLIEPSTKADFSMLYFNADGSFGGMCGNGGRCIAMYAHRAGYAGGTMRFEALGRIYKAAIVGEEVRLGMTDPARFRRGLRLRTKGQEVEAHFIDTGSPHLVVVESDLESIDVQGRGSELRFHGEVAPEGANVNFVQVLDPSTIRIRTYERGVEGETLACGTGSVASAVVSSLLGLCRPPVSVRVRSGETLRVDFETSDHNTTHVTLQGSAYILFKGRLLYDPASCRLQAWPVRA
jgi:diaminopimelate epimerase